MSYASERMQACGITPDNNKVPVFAYDWDGFFHRTDVIEMPVFEEDKLGLRINVFTIDGYQIPIEVPHIKPKSWYYKDCEIFHIIRLENPALDKNGRENKYRLPQQNGTFPFFPPKLMRKFRETEKIETLIITEGYIKAFVGELHGLDIVGLSSITHYRNKEGKLHRDIERLIEVCSPDRVYILHDGDNRDLSTKDLEAGKDLYRRINSFFSAAYGLQEALLPVCKKAEAAIYYGNINKVDFHVNGEKISPKGLDDILLVAPNPTEVVKELLSFAPLKGIYNEKVNVSMKAAKLRSFFNLNSIEAFYDYYSEIIGEKEFNFNGSMYKYIVPDGKPDDGKVEMLMPAEAAQYMRIGTRYYRLVSKRNKYGILETELMLWEKSTISEDYGKEFLKKIAKYNAFVVYPDHVNYQRSVDSCYNLYFPLEWEPEEGEFPTSMEYVKHIFGEEDIEIDGVSYKSYELGLDYIQLLYQQPAEALPVLALVSKERETGKTTFGKWMQAIFKSNVTWMGNMDWGSGFNGMMAGKLLIMTEEAMLEKDQMMETIKALSTADKLLINRKGQDQVNIDFFSKFIFFSNKEENFLRIDKDENRFWVRKIPKLKKSDPFFFERLQSEIEAFLDFLNKRSLVTKKSNRMWFDYKLTQTDALKAVKAASVSSVEKIIRHELREMFLEHRLDEIKMSAKNIREIFFDNRKDLTYIRKVLDEDMHQQKYRNDAGEEVAHRYSFITASDQDGNPIMRTCNEKPYVFRREDFVKSDEIVEPDIQHIPSPVQMEVPMVIPSPTEDIIPF